MKKLTLTSSSDVSIPPEIGLLQNLEELNIYDNHAQTSVFQLRIPREIGKLKKLEKFCIMQYIISEFPEAFWDLPTLRILKLHYATARITSSIKRLQNLEELFVKFTGTGPAPSEISDQLQHIGKLKKLRKLFVGCFDYRRPIQTLTLPSLENLEHLEYLQLNFAGNCIWLPTLEHVRKLTNLKFLYIFPLSLPVLDIEAETHELMLGLVQASNIVEVNHKLELGRPKLTHALACNRFKYRTPFRCAADELFPILNKLWPRMLSNATRPFGRISGGGYWNYPTVFSIEPHDAVYKLLLDGRGSFAQVLVRRSSGNNK